MALPTKSLCPGASSRVTRVGSRPSPGVTGVTNLACATSTVTPRDRSSSVASSANAQPNEALPRSAASLSFRLCRLASTAPTAWSTRPINVDLPASTCPSTTTCMSRAPAEDACASSSSVGTYSSIGRRVGRRHGAFDVDDDIDAFDLVGSLMERDANPGTTPPEGLTLRAITASSGEGDAKSNPGGGGSPPDGARGAGRAG
mmetsp:Transcript_11268/g.45496  ORF Transcript_11268/g.45496 Transcript_11268/m.45496 type:complete len:202 (+) Transcript_11268:2784-3389(+)